MAAYDTLDSLRAGRPFWGFHELAAERIRKAWNSRPRVGRGELIARLEQHQDVLECFFYPTFAELAASFRTECLELFNMTLDSACQWRQTMRKSLVSPGNPM